MHLFISRKRLGVLDYVLSLLTIASPWIFGFQGEYLAPQIAVVAGSVLLLYSLFTDYELGLIRALPFAGNRLLDIFVGVGLGASFIHFALGGRAGVAFAVLGVLILVNAFCTSRPKDPASS
jgi:hypothetical protein